MQNLFEGAEMKSYRHCFQQMLRALMFGIPLGCGIVGLPWILLGFATDPNPLDNLVAVLAKAAIVGGIAGLISLLLGMFYGAPVGAWLFCKGWANAWTAAAAGCLPGLGFWAITSQFETAIFPILFGVPVAVSTYHFAKRTLLRIPPALKPSRTE